MMYAMRYGKKIGEKFAFKISGQLIKAQDWQANDTSNLLRTNVFSKVKPGTRQSDPNYDGINVFGDEASTSMNSFSQAVLAQNLPAVVGGTCTGVMEVTANRKHKFLMHFLILHLSLFRKYRLV